MLHKLISRCLENRCQRLLKLLKLHVQLLDGHCHLLLCSRHGLLARGATRRAQQLSYPQRLPTFDSELGLQSLSDCFVSSLDRLDTSVPGALRSTLSLGALRSTRQQLTIPVFRDAITVPLIREATITAPPNVMNVWMGCDIHTRVLRSEKGCRIRVTHVHTRSDCVHTRDDTVRLYYVSRFVRVIYNSHIVSIKLGTVTGSTPNFSNLYHSLSTAAFAAGF